MAAVIMLMVRPHVTPQTKEFFSSIDRYIESQGLGMVEVDDFPRTYFTEKQVPPDKIRALINTIKNTKNYQHSVTKIWYTTNLTQA